MEDNPSKVRKYYISFKTGQAWEKVFKAHPEELKRIKLAYLAEPNKWHVAFNERRVEGALRSLYEPFIISLKIAGDDGKVYSVNKKPIFAVSDISYLAL